MSWDRRYFCRSAVEVLLALYVKFVVEGHFTYSKKLYIHLPYVKVISVGQSWILVIGCDTHLAFKFVLVKSSLSLFYLIQTVNSNLLFRMYIDSTFWT